MSDNVLIGPNGERRAFPRDELVRRIGEGWRVEDGARYDVAMSRVDDATGQNIIEHRRLTGAELRETVASRRDLSIGALTPDVEQAANQQARQRAIRSAADERGFVGTALRSAGDVLTLGIIGRNTREAAERAGTGDDFAAISAQAEQDQPGAVLLGEAAGLVGGPMSMLRAASIGGIGVLAGRGAASVAGRAGLGRVGQAAARGAVEGGVSDALIEAARSNSTGNWEDIGERMLSAGVMGGIFGGAADAVFSAIGGALGRGARRITGSADNAAPLSLAGMTAEQAEGATARMYASQQAASSQGALGRLRQRVEVGVSGVDLESYRPNLNIDGTPNTGPSARSGWSIDDTRAAIDWSNNQNAYVRELAEGAANTAQGITEALSVMERRGHAGLRDMVASEPASSAVAASVQDIVRTAQRDLGAAFEPLAASFRTSGKGMTLADVLDIRTRLIDQSRRPGSTAANHARMYGREIDRAIAGSNLSDSFRRRYQDYMEVQGDFRSALDRIRKAYGEVGADGVAVIDQQMMLNQINRAAKEGLETEFIQSMLQTMDYPVETLGRLLPDADARRLESALGGLSQNRTRELVARAEAYLASEQFIRKTNQNSGLPSAIGIQGGSIGAVVGGFIGGPIGAVAGAAAGIGVAGLTKPMTMRMAAERFRQAWRGQDNRIFEATSRISDRFSGKQVRAGVGSLRPRAGTIASTFVVGSRREQEDRYEELASMVEDLAVNLESQHDMLDKVFGALQMEEVGEQGQTIAAEKASNAIYTLFNSLPSSRRARGRSNYAVPSIRIRPSRTEMDAFLQAAAVVEDPVFGVELFSVGALSNSGARAMESAYPRMYGELVNAVFGEYSAALQRDRVPDYQTVVQTSTLLGIGLDQTMEPSFISSMQQTYSQTSEQERAVRSMQTVQREIGNLYASQATTVGRRIGQ